MNEKLFQFIWQFRYYNNAELQTTLGKKLEILYPGSLNVDQGPDFLGARIKIDDTIWAGSIELHVKSGEWIKHNHGSDPNYSNVILHVVYEEDVILDVNFPTLQLKERISRSLLGRYQHLMQSGYFISCQDHLKQVNPIILLSWKERMMIERLEARVIQISTLLEKNNYHWEEVFWWKLAANFGMKVNVQSFEKIAQSVPVNILKRHKNQLIQLEALLLGQACLLDKQFNESYPKMLRKEYEFLQRKYGLVKVPYPLYFLRMRPANFPTVRLAQLAALIHKSHHLFSAVKDASDHKSLVELFEVDANDYWHYHYRLDEPSVFHKKSVGEEMTRNIIINTLAPMVYAYGKINRQEPMKLKAMQWLQDLAAEKNSITKKFEALGVENRNAFDSQALLHLKKVYCDNKHCLQCSIGNHILKYD